MRRFLHSAVLSLCVVGLSWASAGAQPLVAFDVAGEFDTDLTPLGIAVGDFDGDGTPDLCTANSDAGNVSVLLGNGDGTFDDTLDALEAGLVPVSVATGDINDDGRIDIVAADDVGSTIGALLNQGAGTFAPVVMTDTGAAPESVVLGKFDADRFLDAATANYDDGTVTVLKGVGDGSFTISDEILVGESPIGLATAELNGDGRLDLVVTNGTGGDDFTGSITVLRGLEDAKFEALPEILVDCDNTDCMPVAVGIADFNTDGKLDLAVVNNLADNVSIFLGDGNLGFTAGAIVPTGSDPEALAIADFNGDRLLDIATTSEFQDKAVVLVGKGDGTFLPQPSTTVTTAAAPGATTVVLADATRFPVSGWVQLGAIVRVQYTSKAGNTLTLSVPLTQDVPATTIASLVFPTDTSPFGLVTADFNDDGKPDLAAANADADDVTVFLNTSGAVSPCVGDCKNDGEVTVDDLIIMVNIANGASPIADCLAGDANGDGMITIDDIIIAVSNALNGCPLQ